MLLKNWLLIAVCVALPALGALAASRATTPLYSASATSFVSLSFGKNPAELTQGSLFVKSQLESFARLTKTPVVLEPVIEGLGLDVSPGQLASQVSASIPGDTSMIVVRVTDPSPTAAADIANAVANQLVVAAQSLAPKNDNDKATLVITTVQEASPPANPTSPKTNRNVALAGFAGLIVGVALAFLRASMDTRVRTTAEVTQIAQAPLLAEIPANSQLSKGKSVLVEAQGEPTLEQYRRLRANLRFVAIGRSPLILAVSSAIAGEGKSTVVTNLALTYARGGDRILVIDADLRKQRASSVFGVEGAVGLTGVLTGQVSFADAVQSVRTAGGPLSVLPAGELPPNPVELLGSPQMRQLIDEIVGDYDVIIVDTPAVVPVVDAAVVAEWASGVLLVARVGHVHRRDLEAAVTSIKQSGASVLGVTVNGVKASAKHAYYGNAGKPAKPRKSGTARGKRSAERSKQLAAQS